MSAAVSTVSGICSRALISLSCCVCSVVNMVPSPSARAGQEKILDGGIDRGARRNGSRPWTRVAVVDAREDEHGHAGHLLRRPLQSPSPCQTRGAEREHGPPRGEAEVDNALSMPGQEGLPYACAAVLERNLFVTLSAHDGELFALDAERPCDTHSAAGVASRRASARRLGGIVHAPSPCRRFACVESTPGGV